MIRCILTDDEPLALDLLADHIAKVPGLELVLATSDPLAAIAAVQGQLGDLLFLDIRMPQLSGLEVLGIIGKGCQVVVTSAYPEYAIHGFEHQVADYLLKPVSFARFLTAVNRVREKLHSMAPPDDFVYLKVGQRMQRVNFDEVLYVEGLKDHVRLYITNGQVTVLQTMKGLEELLPAGRFVRVHKSYLVAISRIEQIHKQHIVVGGTIIPIGEFYRDRFLKLVLKG